MLIEDVTGRELGGEASIQFRAGGVRARITGSAAAFAEPAAAATPARPAALRPPAPEPVTAGASLGPPPVAAPGRIRGLKVIIVEDAILLAMELEAGLTEAGAEVVGSAGELEEAMGLLGQPIDAAVLDCNLNGVSVEPVAQALAARGVPFLFATAMARTAARPKASTPRSSASPTTSARSSPPWPNWPGGAEAWPPAGPHLYFVSLARAAQACISHPGPERDGPDAMLIIENLTHVYPNGVKALDDVDLVIPPGMYGLLGPNGAGKSTLMRIVATLLSPTSGHVRFNDIDVLKDPQALRRVLGYLPQDFGVYPRVSAYDMLDHLAILKGVSNGKERKAVVESLLSQVNLWNVRKKALTGFSGGMRQRFGIAQALIGDPKLIIVDEPTAGLDPEERNRFLNLLAEIGENMVVILSTHIVEDVADLCPAMAIISGGRIVRHGAPAELVQGLKGHIWIKTIGKPELADYQARYDVISTRLYAGRTVIHVLADTDPGDGFEPVPGGLEDLYFSTLSASRRAAA